MNMFLPLGLQYICVFVVHRGARAEALGETKVSIVRVRRVSRMPLSLPPCCLCLSACYRCLCCFLTPGLVIVSMEEELARTVSNTWYCVLAGVC